MADHVVPVAHPSAASPSARSLYDELREEIVRDATPNVNFNNRMREHWTVEFSTDLPHHMLQALTRASTFNKDEVNENILAAKILLNLCVGIYRSGEPVVDEHGNSITFSARSFEQAMGVDDPVEAVRVFYKKDGYLNSTADALLRECGYGNDVRPDPTER